MGELERLLRQLERRLKKNTNETPSSFCLATILRGKRPGLRVGDTKIDLENLVKAVEWMNNIMFDEHKAFKFQVIGDRTLRIRLGYYLLKNYMELPGIVSPGAVNVPGYQYPKYLTEKKHKRRKPRKKKTDRGSPMPRPAPIPRAVKQADAPIP